MKTVQSMWDEANAAAMPTPNLTDADLRCFKAMFYSGVGMAIDAVTELMVNPNVSGEEARALMEAWVDEIRILASEHDGLSDLMTLKVTIACPPAPMPIQSDGHATQSDLVEVDPIEAAHASPPTPVQSDGDATRDNPSRSDGPPDCAFRSPEDRRWEQN